MTSVSFLRQRAARRRREQAAWEDTLSQEQLDFERMCRVRVEQANGYARQLGQDKVFKLDTDTALGVHVAVVPAREAEAARGSTDGRYTPVSGRNHRSPAGSPTGGGRSLAFAAAVVAAAPSKPRRISLQLFLREHAKMREMADKGTGSGAAGGGGRPATAGGRLGGGDGARKGPTRAETVAQIDALVDNTRQLTAMLHQQLAELKAHGWNQVVFEAVDRDKMRDCTTRQARATDMSTATAGTRI